MNVLLFSALLLAVPLVGPACFLRGGCQVCEPISVEGYLRRIPFAVCSMAELCTKQGSYEREVATRVYEAVRTDIEKAISLMEAEKSSKGG